MRFVVYGAGAIGGVVGARLHQSGHDVALIARGAHLEAIQSEGLRFATPAEDEVLAIPAAEDPAALEVGRAGDVVLLAVKSQDTSAALDALITAGADDVPIVCLQNGVANERTALRWFARVYGAVVMLPAGHLEPGLVEGYGAKASGIVDLGRYPEGTDDVCDEVAGALSISKLQSTARPDIMRCKYAKLILNLNNAVGALIGPDDERRADLTDRVRAEGRAVLDAAGINYRDDTVDDLPGRMRAIGHGHIAGRARAGSSSWQSLARGTGAIETDYLNGEIVLLGRLHGVATPINSAVTRLARRQATDGGPPEALHVEDVLAVAA